ncbi:uncharacterized protein L969DRAFT_73327 [Mixia osmundae IAM 14324]|uniref:protein disulfide-isomerase n=1 Tax=Mixia osmundae (strain CBS 9802 / IAM 14324 / JCM 22182 / KY 12970) TaxID=764103 RepID=G7E9S0_MIXOS|nr:uncharacterized protein L969DRAFT_73327 [Mixia osmundae IAM 14324]KEI40021.1 hypothetical protein L969DRAFT_73327 [Mixia osmundae IAM 14324]GAA99389.1 hypothetical protein E5Q_06086 [Mixia osmundae IAM 14324]
MRTACILAALLAACTPALAGLEACKISKKLDAKNFDSVIGAGSKGTLAAFFAPWCGHCKTLAPTWDKVALDFAAEEGCQVAHLDADAAENKPTASKYGVRSYPTIKWFPGDGSAPQDYSSGRTEDSLLEFLNKKCGTSRMPGGALSDSAGRIPTLDTLAGKFLGSTNAARIELVNEAKTFAESLTNSSASYYVKVMNKLAVSSDYLETESKRLSKLAEKKGQLAGRKLDELQIRQNILKAFKAVQDAVDEGTDAAKQKADDLLQKLKEEL